MPRVVAVLVLVSFLVTGCGKGLIAGGAVVATVGAVGMASDDGAPPDDPYDRDYVNFDMPSPGAGTLLLGLAMMMIGTTILVIEHDEHPPAHDPSVAASPIVTVPPVSGPGGRWRQVPTGPDEEQR